MIKHDTDDTIAAISTAIGTSGIGIVRISGKDALLVADKVFLSRNAKRPSRFKSYTTHYGWIISSTEKKLSTNIIDEVLLTVMRAPRSYTKEDIVEINCHGGIAALKQVLDLVLASGCRLAHPGEFTKRAFLNGRIDLAQAEAVLDIIRAKTDEALRIGVGQLKGYVSREINSLRQALIGILARLEAGIDFPEDEIREVDLKKMSLRLEKIVDEIKNILEAARFGRMIREGIKIVICGKPNVGKSSLLNALLKEERSIVTPIAGTTRDTIEEVVNIRGIPATITDTAGMLKPRDLIEKKAIQRSRDHIAAADLVLLLLDGSKKLGKEDARLIQKLKKKAVFAVINKIDLKQKIEKELILKKFKNVAEVSAKKMKNIIFLEDEIARVIYRGRAQIPDESALVSNFRHIERLKEAQKFIAEASNSLDNDLSLEFVSQGIRDALLPLDEILGKAFSEDVLDKIFNEFCIGK